MPGRMLRSGAMLVASDWDAQLRKFDADSIYRADRGIERALRQRSAHIPLAPLGRTPACLSPWTELVCL
jgi:hypothetical protein